MISSRSGRQHDHGGIAVYVELLTEPLGARLIAVQAYCDEQAGAFDEVGLPEHGCPQPAARRTPVGAPVQQHRLARRPRRRERRVDIPGMPEDLVVRGAGGRVLTRRRTPLATDQTGPDQRQTQNNSHRRPVTPDAECADTFVRRSFAARGTRTAPVRSDASRSDHADHVTRRRPGMQTAQTAQTARFDQPLDGPMCPDPRISAYCARKPPSTGMAAPLTNEGGVGAQPHHQFGDLGRLPEAAGGVHAQQALPVFRPVAHALGHRRPHVARAHRVDADALGGVVERRRPGEAHHAVLAGHVTGLPVAAHAAARHAVDGGDVAHRPAALRHHLAQLLLHAQEHAVQVDRDGALPALPRHLGHAAPVAADAGTVERAVQPAVALQHGRQQRFHVSRLGDVGLHGHRLAAGGLHGVCGLLAAGGILVGNGHPRPLAGEHYRRRPARAPTRRR